MRVQATKKRFSPPTQGRGPFGDLPQEGRGKDGVNVYLGEKGGEGKITSQQRSGSSTKKSSYNGGQVKRRRSPISQKTLEKKKFSRGWARGPTSYNSFKKKDR